MQSDGYTSFDGLGSTIWRIQLKWNYKQRKNILHKKSLKEKFLFFSASDKNWVVAFFQCVDERRDVSARPTRRDADADAVADDDADAVAPLEEV